MKDQHMDMIQAIVPQGEDGHQFVIYADSCSGIPETLHATNLLNINTVLKRLHPQPEFVCFPGDEISGLTNEKEELLKQWEYWRDVEMKWLRHRNIPMYNTTGNHTTYNVMSEHVFREVFSSFPPNGPAGQQGLSYFIRRDNLLMIFVNTMWSGLGGEGRVETTWLDSVFTQHPDVEYRLVFGHHPIFAINGFSGDFQRTIEAENGKTFWDILKKHHVLAYVCSHLLAFDVQVHDGILQIVTAGAGTAHRMPKDTEYLHGVQAALDASGLSYQVLDQHGQIREWLQWPLDIAEQSHWTPVSEEDTSIPVDTWGQIETHTCVIWEFSGISADLSQANPQTLISGWESERSLPFIWIGLTGAEQRVTVYLSPEVGRSPHHWYGPKISPNKPFHLHFAIHNGMGPGGLLWRWDAQHPWSSLRSSTPWGAERLTWPSIWSVGNHVLNSGNHMGFRGRNLQITYVSQSVHLQDFMNSYHAV